MKKKSTTEIVIQAKILMKGVHLTIFKKKLFDRKFSFSYEERYTYESQKAKKYMSPYYFLFYIQYEFIQNTK